MVLPRSVMCPEASAERVAVTSRSFSKHPALRSELVELFPNTTFNDAQMRFDSQSLVQFLAGHDRAIVALDRIDGETLAHLPDLRVVSKFGVGLESIDLRALKRRGVRLGWSPGVNRRAVAELTLMLMLGALRRTFEARDAAVAGRWGQLKGRQLSGRTVGIVGLGNIGQDLVSLLVPFGCRVMATD